MVAWLQRGRIDREAGLLKALSTVPLVRSLPVAAAAAVPGLPPPAHPPAAQVSLPASAVLAAEGQSEPLPVLSPPQLAANRPDGFSGILAPVRLLSCQRTHQTLFEKSDVSRPTARRPVRLVVSQHWTCVNRHHEYLAFETTDVSL